MSDVLSEQGDLLTAREAETLTGLRYGYLEQARRMVRFIESEPDPREDRADFWRSRTPPWVKVGNRFMYRRADLAPFMTNRAGGNRNGLCGTCRHYKHASWEIGSEFFDPDKAYCTWAGEHLTEPENAPPWVAGALRQRVSAKSGRGCKAFSPAVKTAPS